MSILIIVFRGKRLETRSRRLRSRNLHLLLKKSNWGVRKEGIGLGRLIQSNDGYVLDEIISGVGDIKHFHRRLEDTINEQMYFPRVKLQYNSASSRKPHASHPNDCVSSYRFVCIISSHSSIKLPPDPRFFHYPRHRIRIPKPPPTTNLLITHRPPS